MTTGENDLLDGSIDEVRDRLKQFGSIHDENIVQTLVEITGDSDRAGVVREEAAMALGRSDSENCREKLNSMVESEDAVMRQMAAIGLGEDRADETIFWLIDLLTDAVNKVRNLAERSLLKRTSQMATVGVDALLELFTHPLPLTRSPAARLIGQTQDERGLAPLLIMLQSETWLERLWAAKGLGDLGKQDAVPALVDLLNNDEKNRVRAAAADALGVLRPENIVAILTDSSKSDEDEGVRKTAHEALLALEFETSDSDVDPFAED